MYRVIRASILYYEEHMKGSAGRYELIRPMRLLVDRKEFNDAKARMSAEYVNLCDLISEMRRLNSTGEIRYHHFEMLLNELQTLGFDVETMQSMNITKRAVIEDQIDLMLQFLAFRYPFDAYDNKIGVHDMETNQFIFKQP